MTEDNARRVCALLAARDELETWREMFEESIAAHPNHTMVAFCEPEVRKDTRYCEEEDSEGWQGNLLLPRDIAIRMLLREAAAIAEELVALGIEAGVPA